MIVSVIYVGFFLLNKEKEKNLNIFVFCIGKKIK